MLKLCLCLLNFCVLWKSWKIEITFNSMNGCLLNNIITNYWMVHIFYIFLCYLHVIKCNFISYRYEMSIKWKYVLDWKVKAHNFEWILIKWRKYVLVLRENCHFEYFDSMCISGVFIKCCPFTTFDVTGILNS